MSDQAIALLKETASDRQGYILYGKFINGVVIQTNGKQFVEDQNPRSRAKWEGALQELIELGLLRDLGKGEVFTITREGYDVAELLLVSGS